MSDSMNLFKSTILQSRKLHYCRECGKAIRKGEKYERIMASWEGCWKNIKRCLICAAVPAKSTKEIYGEER